MQHCAYPYYSLGIGAYSAVVLYQVLRVS